MLPKLPAPKSRHNNSFLDRVNYKPQLLTFLRSIEIRRQKTFQFQLGMEKIFAMLPRGCLEIAMMFRGNNLIIFDWRCKRLELGSKVSKVAFFPLSAPIIQHNAAPVGKLG